jgi:TRAP-type C4-dicarboxylate transport system permease small subunit
MKFLNGILGVLDKTAFAAVAALMGGMGAIAFAAVFYRFVLLSPLRWSEEAARYMMVWVTFLGAGYAMGRGKHIGVTLFIEKLPEKGRRAAIFAAEILILIFLVAVARQGINLIVSLRRQTSPAMGMPMWIPYLAVPAGAVYMFLHVLRMVLTKSVRVLSTADVELDEALKKKEGIE